LTPESRPRSEKYDGAYQFWVVDGWPLKRIARELKVSVVTLNKWKKVYDWEGDRVKSREALQKRMLEAGIDRRANVLTSLRSLRQIAQDAISTEVIDKVTGVATGPLRPQKFSEAAFAITSSVKEESDIMGWKPLPPQVIAVVIFERKRIAEELVRLATSVLLPAVPLKVRQAVGEAFMSRLTEIEDQLETPPDMVLPVNGNGGMKQAQLVGAPD
jgi:hypothetical protein